MISVNIYLAGIYIFAVYVLHDFVSIYFWYPEFAN